MERQAQRRQVEWRELLRDDVGGARRVLRELLEGPIQFTPVLEEARRGFRFAGALIDRRNVGGDRRVPSMASPGDLAGRYTQSRSSTRLFWLVRRHELQTVSD